MNAPPSPNLTLRLLERLKEEGADEEWLFVTPDKVQACQVPKVHAQSRDSTSSLSICLQFHLPSTHQN